MSKPETYPLKCPRCGHDWNAHDEMGKCRIALNESPSCGACRQELDRLEVLEADLFQVVKWDFNPEEAPESRRVIHHKRVFWCAVDERESFKWGDTDRYMCEISGHKLGEDGCVYRDVLVLGYERE